MLIITIYYYFIEGIKKIRAQKFQLSFVENFFFAIIFVILYHPNVLKIKIIIFLIYIICSYIIEQIERNNEDELRKPLFTREWDIVFYLSFP